jgi:hypothetical protein
MNDQIKTFKSRHGTLIVRPEGVTIKRTWSQAFKNGQLASRTQIIPYESLKEVKRSHLNITTGSLQLTTKPGTVGSTPFNRRARLEFDSHQAHEFRQAQKLIEERLQQLQLIDRHKPHIPQDPSIAE